MVASLSLLNTDLGKQYCDDASDTATERDCRLTTYSTPVRLKLEHLALLAPSGAQEVLIFVRPVQTCLEHSLRSFLGLS